MGVGYRKERRGGSAQEEAVMASMMEDSRVLGFLFGTDEMRAVWSEKNWVQKWLDTEAALARAQGELGVIPRETADVIVSHARAEEIDMDALAEGFRSSITIVPLLNAFKKSLPGDAGEYVHWGATSQDIYDTGLVLMEREACSIILRDAKACLSAILALVKKYRDTPEAGRTHVVHAIPITFGFKAAGWADELGREIERFKEMEKRAFVLEMGGAVGTLASQPEKGLETQEKMAEILGLRVPLIAWHTARDNQAELASDLALLAGTMGRICYEIFTLQRTEILELEEPFFKGKIGSSTMPHKRNAAVLENVLALLRNVRTTAPALEKARYILENLIVYEDHMKKNLFLQKGLMMSECVMMHLARKLGRLTAHHIVYNACMEAYEKEIPLKDVLMKTKVVTDDFTEEEIDTMLNPEQYLGLAPIFCDRVLEAYKEYME